MKNTLILFVFLLISGVAYSEVEIKIPEILSKASSVSVALDNEIEKNIVIKEKGMWKNDEIVKLRPMEIRIIFFKFSGNQPPHLVQVFKGNVIIIHKQGSLKYELTVPISEFLGKIFPDYKKVSP